MNVFGKRERSWRKARKRGVSPIIATILLVAITVVLAAVLYVLISGLTKGPGSTPLGSAFGFGTISQHTGSTTGSAWCKSVANVACYEITGSSFTSGLTVSGINFAVKDNTGAIKGTIFLVSLDQTSYISETSGGTWGTPTGSEITTSTTLSSTVSIWVDSGAATGVFGSGWTITAYGSGSFSSSVGPQSLP